MLCQIQIADDGIGIDEQYRDSIFGLFERLHTADRYPGTGVGLSICKKILDRHDGAISLLPNQGNGQGSVFVVSLPVQAPE